MGELAADNLKWFWVKFPRKRKGISVPESVWISFVGVLGKESKVYSCRINSQTNKQTTKKRSSKWECSVILMLTLTAPPSPTPRVAHVLLLKQRHPCLQFLPSHWKKSRHYLQTIAHVCSKFAGGYLKD